MEPIADTRMAAGALQLAEFIANDAHHRRPSTASADRLMRVAGVLEHRWNFSSWRGVGPPPAAALAASFARSLDAPTGAKVVAFGVARAPGADGREVVVLAWAQRFAHFDGPIARVAAVGDVIRLRGAGRGLSGNVLLAVTAPNGVVSNKTAGDADHIDAEVVVSQPGLWQVELVGTLANGPFPVANFPVYVAVSDDPKATPRDHMIVSESAFREELMTLVNAARKTAGCPSLDDDARLTVAARAHSLAMRDEKFWGHESPRTGSPSDRVRFAGLLTTRSGENIARGPSAQDVHESLMDSPGHRSTIQSCVYTHVGLGIVAGAAHDASDWIVTQEFARINPTIAIGDALRDILSRANHQRAAAGLAELRWELRLAEAAQFAAESMVSPAADANATGKLALAQLAKSDVWFAHLNASWGERDSIESTLSLKSFSATEVDSIGIGVVQASLTGKPTNQLFVVVMTAQSGSRRESHPARPLAPQQNPKAP